MKKFKFQIVPLNKVDYMIVEYNKQGRKVLANTTSRMLAKKKATLFANKKQSSNIYIEAQVAGSILK